MAVLPEAAVGAVIAAVVAALVSLIGLSISKRHKIAEFRQTWIDCLRAEVSDLISHANAIHGALIASTGSASEKWNAAREDFVGVNRAASQIRLRLNPDEDASKSVLEALEHLERQLAPGKYPHHAELNRLEKKLVAATQGVLKNEWRRVRDGELRYRIRNSRLGKVVARLLQRHTGRSEQRQLAAESAALSERNGA